MTFLNNLVTRVDDNGRRPTLPVPVFVSITA
jgi:hypothetical protein